MLIKRLIAVFILLLNVACVSTEKSERIDNIPMYGQPQIERPEPLKVADENFINEAISGFNGNKTLASKAWYAEGDKFMRKHDFDHAMRRYNQSWLLDPNNYQPYWGFGRVMVQKSKFSEAVINFNTAIELCDDDYQLVALLSDTGVAYSIQGQHEKANSLFIESTKLDSGYSPSWLRWSQSLYREGKYKEAWVKHEKSIALGGRISPKFTNALKAKLNQT